MVDCIDKNELIKFLDNIQHPKMPITKGFKYITIDEAIKLISERHTIDAVDREKINKAIKISKDNISTSFKLGLNERAFGMQEILKIFEENIGE